VPQPLLIDIVDTMGRFGRLQLMQNPAHGLVLNALDRAVLEEILRHKKISPMLGARIDEDTVLVHPSERGRLKQALLKVGWPAEDLAGYVDGEHHPITLHEDGWQLRDYQRSAAETFWAGGSGVVVLPCGAGKTLVGAAAMAQAAGHHRDLSGDHQEDAWGIPAFGAVRFPRLGPDRLRRGAPAARAGFPDDRGSAVPQAARADGDSGA
jgi:hypothetical protein